MNFHNYDRGRKVRNVKHNFTKNCLVQSLKLVAYNPLRVYLHFFVHLIGLIKPSIHFVKYLRFFQKEGFVQSIESTGRQKHKIKNSLNDIDFFN
jgi:hypothetical protein